MASLPLGPHQPPPPQPAHDPAAGALLSLAPPHLTEMADNNKNEFILRVSLRVSLISFGDRSLEGFLGVPAADLVGKLGWSLKVDELFFFDTFYCYFACLTCNPAFFNLFDAISGGFKFPPLSNLLQQESVVEASESVTGHIISTTIGGKNGEPKQTISYMAERVVGTGSFGIVFQAKCLESGETVAIKKVLQDKRYKNRELQLMRFMDHPNVISLKHCFFSTTVRDELFLNLVMEYVPESLYGVLRHYSSANQRMPLIHVKLYTYQIFRGLAYIHTVSGVCHRDLKPQNVLVDPLTHQVKICDFGSAKVLVKGEANISYICSRYYRAPELIFGATEYTSSIDVWSAGCVLAELLLGQPLFPGESAVDQLVQIIKVLGTPTREEIRCMNPNYTEFRFPQIKAHPWHKIFHKRMPPEAIDLISRLLQYSPDFRCSALEACAHPFFNELREPNMRLPNGRPLPPLFNFKQELAGASPELINRLIPEHMGRQSGLNFLHSAGT
ncbi:hypothetical protein ZIOFF_046395 [Zingiber officinale]|uniref:non-specific serine/threonine protein kinase n=1 Tax=Zingiber officinale TaxID=94328 RepID=A0A8J5G2P5_ZINOF|nr:hypothetical protein ZIOFF_046395 [Zingiber officinale]